MKQKKDNFEISSSSGNPSSRKKVKIELDEMTLWKAGTLIFGVLFVISILTGGFAGGKSQIPSADDSNNKNQPQAPQQPQGKEDVSADDDPFMGDKKAEVTIIEFSDYQCPFCRKFWTETLPQLKEKYIDTGKVKFIYRDFPLASIHQMAQPSAEAAECARELGGDSAYFKMHDKIFEEQNILDAGSKSGPVKTTVTFATSDLIRWADDLGYDIESCLNSGKYKDEVEKDLADGSKAGVQGTPTFFVNGQILRGAMRYQSFEQVIEAELKS